MIKLACNYHPEVTQLVQAGKVDIDYIKFPALGYQMKVFDKPELADYIPFITELKRIKPVLLHGLLPSKQKIGSKTFIKELNYDVVRRVIELSGTPGISIHLDGIDTTLPNEINKSIIIDNIQYLKMKFNDMEFISCENVHGDPFSDTDEFGICLNPTFISEIVEETGVSFLLDISHAYCTARKVKMGFDDYITALPLDKVYEIHINGWVEAENDIMAHTKINETGYTALESLLKRCDARIVTLEYGRGNDRIGCGVPVMSPNTINEAAKEEIAAQIFQLRDIISRKG